MHTGGTGWLDAPPFSNGSDREAMTDAWWVVRDARPPLISGRGYRRRLDWVRRPLRTESIASDPSPTNHSDRRALCVVGGVGVACRLRNHRQSTSTAPPPPSINMATTTTAASSGSAAHGARTLTMAVLLLSGVAQAFLMPAASR